MSAARLVGGVLLVLGILALVYRGFTVTDRETVFEVGPVEAVTTTKEHVPVPLWLGGLLLVSGVALLVVGPRDRRTT